MVNWILAKLLLVTLVTPVFMRISSKSVPNNIRPVSEGAVGSLFNTSSVRLSATPPPEPEDPYHSNKKEPRPHPAEAVLPGKYRNLNSAELMKSILPSSEGQEGCPEFFEIVHLTPVVNGILELVYDTDLKVDDYHCSSVPEATNLTYLHPYTTDLKPGEGELGSMIFHGAIPNETVTCGEEGTLPETFMSFMDIKMLLNQFLVTYPGQNYKPDKYGIHSKYYLYLGMNNASCIYLKEKDVDVVVALIYEKISNGIYDGAANTSVSEGAGSYPQKINPDEILHSQIDLKQVCSCSAHFPKNISLLPASDMNGENDHQTQGPMDGDTSKYGEGTQTNRKAEEQTYEVKGAEDMPMPILWGGQRCPKKRVYPLEDIVSDREHRFSSNKLGNLMFHGVVEKLFDEIRPEIRSFLPKVLSFESKQRVLIEHGAGLEGMRAVIAFKGGSSCGSVNIPEDIVVLLEVYHILHQLMNSVMIKKLSNGTRQWETVLKEEAFTKKSMTMHLFKRNSTSDLEVCTYTASFRAAELLAEACEHFTPLGGTDPAKIPLTGNRSTSYPNPKHSDPAMDKDQSIPEPGNEEPQNERHDEDDSFSQSTVTPNPSFRQQPLNTTNGNNMDSDESRQDDENTAAPPSTTQPVGSEQVTPSASVLPSPSPESSNTTPSASTSAKPSSSASPSLSISSASISPSASNNSNQTTTTEGLDESACFPGVVQVMLADGSFKKLKDLRVGDHIRDGEGGYSRVLLFAHANPDVMSSFVLLKFNSGALPISSKHYLYVNGTLVTAESAKVGDMISLLHMDPSHPSEWTTITEIERVSMRGLFNPQTSRGSIAVFWKGRPVITSTYTSSLDPALAHVMMWPLRWLDHILGHVLPLCSHFLRNGSAFWHRILPRGPTRLHKM